MNRAARRQHICVHQSSADDSTDSFPALRICGDRRGDQQHVCTNESPSPFGSAARTSRQCQTTRAPRETPSKVTGLHRNHVHVVEPREQRRPPWPRQQAVRPCTASAWTTDAGFSLPPPPPNLLPSMPSPLLPSLSAGCSRVRARAPKASPPHGTPPIADPEEGGGRRPARAEGHRLRFESHVPSRGDRRPETPTII